MSRQCVCCLLQKDEGKDNGRHGIWQALFFCPKPEDGAAGWDERKLGGRFLAYGLCGKSRHSRPQTAANTRRRRMVRASKKKRTRADKKKRGIEKEKKKAVMISECVFGGGVEEEPSERQDARGGCVAKKRWVAAGRDRDEEGCWMLWILDTLDRYWILWTPTRPSWVERKRQGSEGVISGSCWRPVAPPNHQTCLCTCTDARLVLYLNHLAKEERKIHVVLISAIRGVLMNTANINPLSKPITPLL